MKDEVGSLLEDVSAILHHSPLAMHLVEELVSSQYIPEGVLCGGAKASMTLQSNEGIVTHDPSRKI